MGIRRFIARMGLFLLMILSGALLVWPRLQVVALSSPLLSGFITLIVLFGLGHAFFQLFLLQQGNNWIEAHKQNFRTQDRRGPPQAKDPRFLKPLSSLLSTNRYLTAASLAVASDATAARLEDEREPLRYMIGLLIFLGLLGTFWGLSHTIEAIGLSITNLPTSGTDMEGFFEVLKNSLKKPLSGMGIAFGSSLFGLAGSLILGFADLQLSRAHQAFLRGMEEWLAAKLPPVPQVTAASPAFIEAFSQHLGEHLEALQKTLEKAESVRSLTENAVGVLTEQVSRLTDQMRMEQSLLIKVGEGQMKLQNTLADILNRLVTRLDNFDEVTHQHLRHIVSICEKILTNLSYIRKEASEDIRQELRLLGRSLNLRD